MLLLHNCQSIIRILLYISPRRPQGTLRHGICKLVFSKQASIRECLLYVQAVRITVRNRLYHLQASHISGIIGCPRFSILSCLLSRQSHFKEIDCQLTYWDHSYILELIIAHTIRNIIIPFPVLLYSRKRGILPASMFTPLTPCTIPPAHKSTPHRTQVTPRRSTISPLLALPSVSKTKGL